jgi:small-conductance mechanosensitive channel
MIVQTWGEVLSASFKGIWFGIASILPNIIFAIVIILLGWLIGAVIEKLIIKLITASKLDNVLTSAGLRDLLNKGGFNLNTGVFLGALVKWFLIIVFLTASMEVLGLSQVNDFLKNVVLGYLPQVIAAVLILIFAAVVAEVVQKTVVGSTKAAGFNHSNLLGNIVKWAIWIFAILMALTQLGFAVSLLNTLFMGIVVALALALGLSFGLGGQEAAARYIEKVRGEISNR